jgi:hypothetical protein
MAELAIKRVGDAPVAAKQVNIKRVGDVPKTGQAGRGKVEASEKDAFSEVDTFQNLLATKDGGKWEGSTNELVVPASSEQSGATVGTGFDIGQLNKAGLKKLNLPSSLYNKLIPYVGKKGKVARDFLKDSPLTLSDEEVSSIDQKVVSKTIDQVKSRMSDKTAWDDMTETEKFAAIAAQHQYGNKTKLPVQFGNRDWEGARKNLRTWSDKTKGVGKNIAAKYQGLVSDIDKERPREEKGKSITNSDAGIHK